MAKKRFPTFIAIVLILAFLWLLTDIGVLNIRVPWVPVIIVVWALGVLVNHYQK